MAFSLLSFFGKDKNPNDAPSSSPSSQGDSQDQAAMNTPQSPGSNPLQNPATPSPFGSGMLFKTAGGQESLGQPVSSPFSPAAAPPSQGLTVGDILAYLPPETSRGNTLPPMQPLQLAEDVIDKAVQSGRGTVPLFEIYRVCPALFSAPISPQDPRVVPLPIHKLVGRPVETSPVAHPGTSPFQPGGAPAQSPFSVAPGGTPLPPSQSPFTASPAFTANSGFQESGFPQPKAAQSAPASPFQGFGTPPPTEHPSPPPAPTSPFSFGPPAENTETQDKGAAGSPQPFSPFTAAPSPAAPAVGAPDPALFGSLFTPASPPQSSNGNSASHPGPASVEHTSPVVSNPFAPATPAQESAPAPLSSPFGSPFGAPPSEAAPKPSPFSFGKPPEAAEPPNGLPPLEFPAPPSAHPAAQLPSLPPLPGTQPPAQNQPESGVNVNPFARIQALHQAGEATLEQAPVPPAPPASLPSQPEVSPFSPFAAFAPSPAPVEEPLAFSFSAPAPASAPSVKEETIGFPTAASSFKASLAAVLKNCTAMDLGIGPELIPSWVEVSLPAALVQPQIATGRITLPVSKVAEGLAPEFRNLVSSCHPGLMAEFPASVLTADSASSEPTVGGLDSSFTVLPPKSDYAPAAGDPGLEYGGNSPAESALSWGAPKSLPPPKKPADPLSQGFVTPAQEAGLPGGMPWPFAAQPEPESSSPALPESAPEPFLLEDLDTPQPPPAWEKPFAELPSAPSEFPGSFTPEPPLATFGTPLDSPSSIPQSSPAPAPQPSFPSQSGIVIPNILKGNLASRHRQMLLRAILGGHGDMDLQGVVDHFASLPGVTAVVCLKDEQVIASAGDQSHDASRFTAGAAGIRQHLEPLLKLTGVEEAEPFSIRSEQSTATFSVQERVTMGVLHASGMDDTSLVEKLTLVARELPAMVS